MILLDTDHFTALRYTEHSRSLTLTGRLGASGDTRVGITAITVEEQMRGWLAEINRLRDLRKQVAVYERLAKLVELLKSWEVVPFDARALVHNALLLAANLRDFRRVPGLRVESWLA
jgi:tRNA(fMet)-specific endonuclease VapC